MTITNLNPDAGIGASAWLVEAGGNHLLLDAGTHPDREGPDSLPLFNQVRDVPVDAIAVSHCHQDHVGALPVALRHFPHAKVFMTRLSYLLVERVLHNSVNVMRRQRDERGIPGLPLFTHEEVDDYAAVFEGVPCRRPVPWASPAKAHHHHPRPKPPTLEFLDAGHTLGSAGIRVRAGDETLFYTGDVCFHDQTLLKKADFDRVRADVLILETTRGAKPTPRGFTRARELKRLAASMQATLAAKGCVLIPAFGLGRTQEILAELALLMRARKLKRQPIFIGGMGKVFSEIYDLDAARRDRRHPRLELTRELDLVVLSPEDAWQMPLGPGRIFVVTAGMMTENTLAYGLACRLLPEKRHLIGFVGYSAPKTPAGRLRQSLPGGSVQLAEGAQPLKRRCQIEEFDLTAHAKREDLLAFVSRVHPKCVVLGHGEADAQAWFSRQIRAQHPEIRVEQLQPGETVAG